MSKVTNLAEVKDQKESHKDCVLADLKDAIEWVNKRGMLVGSVIMLSFEDSEQRDKIEYLELVAGTSRKKAHRLMQLTLAVKSITDSFVNKD